MTNYMLFSLTTYIQLLFSKFQVYERGFAHSVKKITSVFLNAIKFRNNLLH